MSALNQTDSARPNSATTKHALLARQLLFGEWRAHPLRVLVSVAAIATGVALGFAIHLINAAALDEFSSALKGLTGQADIVVSGTEARFDEQIYPWLAQRDGVALASPVLELDAALPGHSGALHIIGLDAMRAGQITPDLVGAPAADNPTQMLAQLLADDTLFLSPAAMTWLQRAPGASIQLQAGTGSVNLKVAGSLQRARVGQRIAVMDLGAAQWRFNLVGQLSRVDLRLAEGINRDTFQAELASRLERDFPGRFAVSHPSQKNERNDNLSRAYRVNLTVLALVALFTGAFLVFSTQALSVIQRRSQFALLRVLGMERTQLLRQVLFEGASLGIVGAALGIAAGYAIAATALHFFGGDLGAGYFSGVQPTLRFTPLAALVYFSLGLAVTLAGCAAPAWEAARAQPAAALKAGSAETALAQLRNAKPAIACLVLAALLTLAPPLFELPLPAYLAIALLLIGAIALMPQLASAVFGWANRRWGSAGKEGDGSRGGNPTRTVPTLALARLANASGQASIALGGVLASFSLMVAMAIMVASFRMSVDDWLLRILPADLYARTSSGGSDTAGLDLRQQAVLQALPGIARVDFLRSQPLQLAPGRLEVTLLARAIDTADPGAAMAMMGTPRTAPAGSMPVWVSEAMVDLYGALPGSTIELPLSGRLHPFFVAGVWRDYARQGGAVQIRLEDYRLLTGDTYASDAGIWLTPGSSPEDARAQIDGLAFGHALALTAPFEIRAKSMTIFDRSFAVTYLLEAIAIAIGLFGVAATFSSQTLARAREFGMLRHIGVSKRQILALLALEGGALTALGIGSGFVLGWLISLILVFIVNPQSFHWTMELHVPWTLLIGIASALLIAAALTALLAGRQALSGAALRAVREDN
jgi:putative ABC transport system permease protein